MATKGSCTSEATRRKQSNAIKAFFLTSAGIKEKARMRDFMSSRKVSEQTRLKMSESKKGTHFKLGVRLTPEQRENMSIRFKRYYKTPEGQRTIEKGRIKRQGMPSNMKGKHHSVEVRAKLSVANMGNKHSITMRNKCRQNMLEFWSNPSVKDMRIKAIMDGMLIRPTKPELVLISILDDIAPNEWKYTGDGQVIICGRNPDIVNVNGKKALILMHGIYWHLWKKQKENPELTKEQVEREDINFYKVYGWESLIIWDDELKNLDKVLVKIKKF